MKSKSGKVLYERTFNLITCKDSNDKTISINLDRVEWFRADTDYSCEIHIFNCQFSIWVNIPEDKFRKAYLNYKKEVNLKLV